MASKMIGYCRICAQRNEELISVFGEHGKCLQLYFKLKICLHVTVMKNDNFPTTICFPCLEKLEECYKLFQLRLKGEDELQRCQLDTLDLSSKKPETQSVMHGECRPSPIRMEEDMFDHPKRRKMRRHWNPEASNPPPPQASHQQICQCETCQRTYGALPLLADAADVLNRHAQSQAQVSEPISGGSVFEPSVSGPSSFAQVPSLPIPPVEHPSIREQSMWCDPPGPSQAAAEEISYVAETGDATSSTFGPSTSTASSYTSLQVRPPPVPSPPQHNNGGEPPRRIDSPGPSRTTKKEVPCEFCGKSFTHTGDLNKHRRIHTGERPYQCRQCDRKFSHASNLLRHSKIHSGERPFSCTLCGKGFSRKDKMLSHKKSGTCVKRSEGNPTSPASPPSTMK